MSEFRKMVKKNGLPFRMYKNNGTEVVFLELDEDKENMFIDKLDEGFKIAQKVYYLSVVYGVEVEMTAGLTLEDLELIEDVYRKRCNLE